MREMDKQPKNWDEISAQNDEIARKVAITGICGFHMARQAILSVIDRPLYVPLELRRFGPTNEKDDEKEKENAHS